MLVPKIEVAVEAYRFASAGDYRIWPEPNSNSFTVAVLRAVPELGVSLPANAIGHDSCPGFYAGLTGTHRYRAQSARAGGCQAQMGRGRARYGERHELFE